MSVYPNPTNGDIQFRSNEKLLALEVIDANGVVFKNIGVSDDDTLINTAELPAGVYSLIFHFEKTIIAEKILKL